MKTGTPELQTLLTGLAFGESPRWHSGRLWFSNWGAQEIISVDASGKSKVELRVPFSSFPFSIDWLPDGRLLIVSASEQPLLRQEPDGSLVPHADLSNLHINTWNEIVVDGRGNIYLNGSSYNPRASEAFTPGIIALITPDGQASQVAGDFAFPNGMAIAPDNSTLIIAESYRHRLTGFEIGPDGSLANRYIWADLGDGTPDGICMDAEGVVWYADVPNHCCVRVSRGGEALQKIELDRGCFACMLGGEDDKTLFMLAAEWGGMENMSEARRTGQLLSSHAPAPGSGWPDRK